LEELIKRGKSAKDDFTSYSTLSPSNPKHPFNGRGVGRKEEKDRAAERHGGKGKGGNLTERTLILDNADKL